MIGHVTVTGRVTDHVTGLIDVTDHVHVIDPIEAQKTRMHHVTDTRAHEIMIGRVIDHEIDHGREKAAGGEGETAHAFNLYRKGENG
jgi:hypothetical protein